MIQTKTYSIPSCDDVELGIKRPNELGFYAVWDDEKDIKGILVVISGLGGDANTSYKSHLAGSIAENLPVVVLCVDYFGIGNNINLGASYMLDKIDKIIFQAVCEQIGFALPKDFESKADDFAFVDEQINKLRAYVKEQKQNGKLSADFYPKISVTIAPARGEWQNMGLMSAIDVINAVLHIRKNPPFKSQIKPKDLPCVLVGSSHGGYIACLAAKYAPWQVDAVIDNSSWQVSGDILKYKYYSNGAFRLMSFGKEIDYTIYPRASNIDDEIFFSYSDRSFWTSQKSSPNYCSPSRLDIRSPGKYDHLLAQSRCHKSIYVGYHSRRDKLADPLAKMEFYAGLQSLGFPCWLAMIENESQVDGRFIKTLDHGLGMSIKLLVLNELPKLLARLENMGKKRRIRHVSYATSEWIYSFSEKNNQLCLECSKIE